MKQVSDQAAVAIQVIIGLGVIGFLVAESGFISDLKLPATLSQPSDIANQNSNEAARPKENQINNLELNEAALAEHASTISRSLDEVETDVTEQKKRVQNVRELLKAYSQDVRVKRQALKLMQKEISELKNIKAKIEKAKQKQFTSDDPNNSNFLYLPVSIRPIWTNPPKDFVEVLEKLRSLAEQKTDIDEVLWEGKSLVRFTSGIRFSRRNPAKLEENGYLQIRTLIEGSLGLGSNKVFIVKDSDSGLSTERAQSVASYLRRKYGKQIEMFEIQSPIESLDQAQTKVEIWIQKNQQEASAQPPVELPAEITPEAPGSSPAASPTLSWRSN